MDPNNWASNFNQQYGQLTDGSNLSQNPTILGHHELSAVQQAGLTATENTVVIETQKDWNMSTTVPSGYVLTKQPGTIKQPQQQNVEVLLNAPQPAPQQIQQLSQCVYQETIQTSNVFTDYTDNSLCSLASVAQQTQYADYDAPIESSAPSFVVQSADQYNGAAPTAAISSDVTTQNSHTLSGIHGNLNSTISLEDLAAVRSHDIVQPSGVAVSAGPVTVQAIADSTTGNRKLVSVGRNIGKVKEASKVDTDTSVAGQLALPAGVVYDTVTMYDPTGVDTDKVATQYSAVVYDGQQVEPGLSSSGEQVYLMNTEGSTFLVHGDTAVSVSNTDDKEIATDAAQLTTAVVVESKPVKVRTFPRKSAPTTPKLTVSKKELDTCGPFDDLNHAPVPRAPKPVPGVTSFQNSFLSFLQGRRQETLSSVTTSIVSKKPVLPKYIPLPKSAVKPPSSNEKASSQNLSGESISANSSPVTLTKKVEHILPTSGDDAKAAVSTPKTVCTAVATVKSVGNSARHGRRLKKIGRQLSGTPKTAAASDDEEFNPVEEGEVMEEAPPVAPRVRPMRKAKEKFEQKRNKMKTKKSKRSASDLSDTSSDEFLSTLIHSDEDAVDSDSDPSWMPAAEGADTEKRRPVSDEEGRTRRGRGRGKRPRLSPSRPGGVHEGSAATDATKVIALPGFQRGTFVIEKSHLEKGSGWKSQPIWKVDVSRLLKKYEPTKIGDRLTHTAKTTYTSWNNHDEANYCAVRVRSVASSNNEDIVEVIEVGPPPQPSSDDMLVQPFDVYVQILLSQALEPGFLSALQDQPDDYYMGPLNLIDVSLAECKTCMLDVLHWTTTFTEAVEHYPYIHVVQSSDLKDHCQACEDASEEAVKAVMLTGNSYDRITLVTNTDESVTLKQKVFSVGALTSQHVTAYHSMQHFKFRLYQTCVAKVNWLKSKNVKEHSEILEQCLQDREWIQKLYRSLKELQKQSHTIKSLT